jgi:hypothetical protein
MMAVFEVVLDNERALGITDDKHIVDEWGWVLRENGQGVFVSVEKAYSLAVAVDEEKGDEIVEATQEIFRNLETRFKKLIREEIITTSDAREAHANIQKFKTEIDSLEL